MSMRLDPVSESIIRVLDERFHGLGEVSISEIRQRMVPPPASEWTGIETVEDVTLRSGGSDLRLRVYRPVLAEAAAILFLHGGGWVIGNLDSQDATCRRLAVRTAMVVVSVDYRLAPEHRFPAPVDDALAALEWARAHAQELKIDPSAIAIAGTSAGANIAAGCTIAARSRGIPGPRYQILAYPIVDCDFDTGSYRANRVGFGITRDHLIWFWDQYAPDRRQRTDPRAAPLRAPDLSELPPAVVVTAEFDPLRDEGENYAARLRHAGVAALSVRFNGMFHGFLEATGSLSAADAAFDLIAEQVRAAVFA